MSVCSIVYLKCFSQLLFKIGRLFHYKDFSDHWTYVFFVHCKAFIFKILIYFLFLTLPILGLYRLCGSETKKSLLREAFEEDPETVDLSSENVPDINVITSKFRKEIVYWTVTLRKILLWFFCLHHSKVHWPCGVFAFRLQPTLYKKNWLNLA